MTTRSFAISLFVAFFVVGCGFERQQQQFDGGDGDGFGLDDGGFGDGGSDMPNSACIRPQLLVAVENLKNPATGGGRVARLALGDGSAFPTECLHLTGGGLIKPQPFSIAWFGLNSVAAATRDGLDVIDPDTDTIRFSAPISTGTLFPVDAFSIKAPTGELLIAAAYNSGNTSPPLNIREVHAFTEQGTMIFKWCVGAATCAGGTTLPLGLGIYGMTTSPNAANKLLALDGTTPSAGWDVDPFGAIKTEYRAHNGVYLTTVYSLVVANLKRTVWVDQMSPTAIYYANDFGGAPSISGPIRCSSICPTILHAVPDPTSSTRFFALCDAATVNGRRVVRFTSTGGPCETVLDGAILGSESRLSRLAVAQ